MLDDPRLNFAISRRSEAVGINHLGLQFDSDESNKHWSSDPQGIAWEAFHTLRDIPIFGDDTGPRTPSIGRRQE